MLRLLALSFLVLTTGCAATRGQLIDGPASLTKESTPTCADISIRRPALASRWGEFLRVRIEDTDAVIVGQAKLKVGARVEKEKAFFVSGHDLVLEMKWSNERPDVASALARGTMLELSLSDLTAAAGRCENIHFTVEQGAVVPDIDEKEWLAQLGSPSSVHKRAVAPPPVTKKPSATRADNDWAAWVGKNADFDTGEWKPWPLAAKAKVIAPAVGTPLAKGVWVAFNTQPPSAFKLPAPDSPAAMSALVTRVRALSQSDEDAVATLFGARTEGATLSLTLATAFSLGWPVPDLTDVTSPFGMRNHPILGHEQLHTGIDLSVPLGTPIIATGPGVVIRAGETKVNGRFCVIDHGHGVTTAYLHNSRVLVVEGQRVQAGDFVSISGNTGRSTGPHLHYQLELSHHPVDPLFFASPPTPARKSNQTLWSATDARPPDE